MRCQTQRFVSLNRCFLFWKQTILNWLHQIQNLTLITSFTSFNSILNWPIESVRRCLKSFHSFVALHQSIQISLSLFASPFVDETLCCDLGATMDKPLRHDLIYFRSKRCNCQLVDNATLTFVLVAWLTAYCIHLIHFPRPRHFVARHHLFMYVI